MKLLTPATLTLIAGTTGLPSPSSTGIFEALPPGASDGTYRGTLKPDGGTAWEYLKEPGLLKGVQLASRNAAAPLVARAQGQAPTGAYCTGRDIDADDVDRAIAAFGDLCGGGHTFNSVLAIQHGGAIAYGCFYGDGQTSCYNDRNSGPGLIRRAVDYCGRGRSAWYSLPSGRVSYGVNNFNQPFC